MWQDAWSLSKRAIKKIPSALFSSTGYMSLLLLNPIIRNPSPFGENSELFQVDFFAWLTLFFESIYIVGLSLVFYLWLE